MCATGFPLNLCRHPQITHTIAQFLHKRRFWIFCHWFVDDKCVFTSVTPALCVWNPDGSDESLLLPYSGAFEVVAHSVQVSPFVPYAVRRCGMKRLGRGGAGVCDSVSVELVLSPSNHTHSSNFFTNAKSGRLPQVDDASCVMSPDCPSCACGTQSEPT